MTEHSTPVQSIDHGASETPTNYVQTGQSGVLVGSSPGRITTHTDSADTRPWWQTAWATRVALILILLLASYFRFLGITTWDSGSGQHPDERFFQDVTSSVRLPASFNDYFDASTTLANPRNVGKGFFVYGTFPVHLTRYVAATLTPPEALPERLPNPRASIAGEPPEIPNYERALPRLPFLIDWLNPEGRNLTSYGDVVNVGRVLVALFDLASIVMVFLIAVRLYDRRVALLAALLSALAVMSIQQSHFYVDPNFSTFFALFALYWAVRVAQGAGWYTYVLMGIGIGGAMGNRITLAAMGAVGIVAAVQAALVWRSQMLEQQKQHGTEPDEQVGRFSLILPHSVSAVNNFFYRSFPLLCLAGFVTLLTFRVVQPYAFIGSQDASPGVPGHEAETLKSSLRGLGFFDIRPEPRFLGNMEEVSGLVSGERDFYPSQQWVGQPSYIYPWVNMVLWGMGPALGLAVWIGWAVGGVLLLLRLRDVLNSRASALTLAPLVLWFWITFYFGWQGNQFAMNMRYMLPIYGALIILGSWLLIAVWDWGTRRLHATANPDTLRRRSDRLAFMRWSLLVVALATLAWAYAFTRIYTRPHPRVMAAQWVDTHIPPGSQITFESWDDPLPLNILGGDPWGTTYRGITTYPYGEDEPQKYYGNGTDFGLLDHLEQADYISLTSNRVYGSTKNLPMRYPATQRYYYHLFNGDLGYELVAEVTSYPTLLGIEIPTQSADESFTVYDHPRVLIFKKTPAFSRERAEELLVEGVNWNEVYKSGSSLPTAPNSAASSGQ
ncbi:MAG: hypothetical protein HC876_03355 [Chloroflexaceae bacterium]|nr:hypothetical protein [Chloroflexaceae bacterium]